MKSRSVVVELFSPPRFTKFAEEKGFVGKAYDIKQGYDLTDPTTQIEVDKEIDKLRPRLLVLCPPCTFWGGWDHLNRVYRSPMENARLNRSKRNQVKFCSPSRKADCPWWRNSLRASLGIGGLGL